MQPENGRLPLVERADEEGAVEHDDGGEGDRRGDELAVDVGRRDAGDRAEQEAVEVAGVARLLLLMITTAALRKPTKRMPIEASSGSGDASARR